MEELEYSIGLHEEVSIIYVVNGYSASLYTRDGSKLLLQANGNSLLESLQNLNVLVKEQGITWQTIRSNK